MKWQTLASPTLIYIFVFALAAYNAGTKHFHDYPYSCSTGEYNIKPISTNYQLRAQVRNSAEILHKYDCTNSTIQTDQSQKTPIEKEKGRSRFNLDLLNDKHAWLNTIFILFPSFCKHLNGKTNQACVGHIDSDIKMKTKNQEAKAFFF